MAKTEKINSAGYESLHHLKSIDPPQWLAPSPSLSNNVREASQYLYSSLMPYTPKSPLEKLHVEGFDAEQIFQQIDLQTQPLLASLRRDITRFEKNPDELVKGFAGAKRVLGGEKEVVEGSDEEGDDEFDDLDGDDDDGGDEDDGDGDGDGDGDDEEGSDDDEETGFGLKMKRSKEKGGVMEGSEDDDAEIGFGLNMKRGKKKGGLMDGSEEEDDDGEDDDEDEDDDLDPDAGAYYRHDDFYSREKKKDLKRRSDLIDASEDSETDDEQRDEQKDDDTLKIVKKGPLSTHEKELLMRRAEIEQMEKENMDKKTWTMQGEITASNRPMNSALEADLDFQHNARPPPVITEEVTASIEELIKKRILEGHWDDVKRAPRLSLKAPREHKELDENKSKKGLAEIYEDEYAHTVNPESAPLTFSDERKKEATMLFKQLCLKLDALSHFHFSPKPVIDDMSIQTNAPALAMEEIAPVAVSDAAMLAPEEVFSGKGDIKEETELTQAERKMRRANKKRKFKAETAKRTVTKRARESSAQNGKELES